MKRVSLLLASSLAFACGESTPVTVGVALPLTGSVRLGFEKPLEWAVEEVNVRGVCGREIELDYEDLGVVPDDTDATREIAARTRRFVTDRRISAVVGTDYDDTTFRIAPDFIRAKKLLVSPSATTVEITRAFNGSKYVWRTVESDVAQSQLMALYAKQTGARTVAVLSTFDLYGGTFFDWIPFYAEELGLEVTGTLRLDPTDVGCAEKVDRVLRRAKPDVFFAIPGTFEQAQCMIREVRRRAPGTRLVFSDGGQYTDLFSAVGADGEGVEGRYR